MFSAIDLSNLPMAFPVLCIPRVFSSITEGRIRRIIDELDIGELDKIDIVPYFTEKKEKMHKVFVHFRHWASNENAIKSRLHLLNGKEFKIIYDDPWFWKVSAYREREPLKSQSKKISIVFEADEYGRDLRPLPNPPMQRRREDFQRRERFVSQDYRLQQKQLQQEREEREEQQRRQEEQQRRQLQQEREEREERYRRQLQQEREEREEQQRREREKKSKSSYYDIDNLSDVVLPESVDYTGAPAVPPLRRKKTIKPKQIKEEESEDAK